MRALVRAKLGVVGVCAMAMVWACSNDGGDSNTTNTVVTVQNMQAISGSNESLSDNLFSDVCDEEATEGGVGFPTTCVAVNDWARVTMQGLPKNFTAPLPAGPPYNDVIFNRYRVTYTRADGRNTAGVDVPYPFDGVMNLFVGSSGQEVQADITLVRQQAKLEPPLINLAGGGGALVISTLGQVDFYGTDVAGRAIHVTGYINVNFGDF